MIKDKVCVQHVLYYRIFIQGLQVSDDEKILVGKIVAPQGIRGEFRVQTFTESPADFRKYTVHGTQYTVQFVRTAGANVAICKMEGIDDRNAAEKLRGMELFVARADLPKPEKGRHYISDLIGMKVIRIPNPVPAFAGMTNRIPNTVVYVHNFGAGDILELDNGDMISFNGADVDYENKEIKI